MAMEHNPGDGRTRQEQQRTCFYFGKKKCRLGVRNELGTRVYDFRKCGYGGVIWSQMGYMLKTTSLGREAALLLEICRMGEYVKRLKSEGMSRWEAYQENRKSLNDTITLILQQRARYKERRLNFGLFYLTLHPRRMAVIVISHFKHMPLKEALRKSRLKRRCLVQKYNTPQERQGHTSLASLAKLAIYTVFSIIFGCIIMFY